MISTIYTVAAANMMTVLAADVKIDGTVSDVEHFIHHMMGHITSQDYNGVLFLFNLAFLFICFIIRYTSYFRIVKLDTSTDEGKKLFKRYRSYVLNHILISAVFAFIICYFLVKIADTAEIVIIWNIIVAPLIGYLASIWFDNEFITKYEIKYKFLRNPLNENIKDGESENKDDHHTEVHVVVNNGEHGTDDKFVLEGDKELSDSKKIEVTINRIIEVQKEQSVILERHTTELKEQNIMLKNMQNLMKNNIKFELEDMIYEALTRGYVTPAEDKRIRVKYKDYTNNNGNGDLEDLYESRYLELEVRDPNR